MVLTRTLGIFNKWSVLVWMCLFFASTCISAEYATVTSVQKLCSKRETDGGSLGRVINDTFGSLGGLVGFVSGVTLADKMATGSYRTLAVVTGGALGYKLGNKLNADLKQSSALPCEKISVYERDGSAGYLVTYDYKGSTFSEVTHRGAAIGSSKEVGIITRYRENSIPVVDSFSKKGN